ncbi:MAG: protein kinase [Roseobacter sp.]
MAESIEKDTEFQDAGSDALAPGSKLLSGQYEIQRYLSSGGFGITYLATDSLNRTVVIKECFPEAFCTRVKKSVRARTQNYVDDFKSIVALFIREAHALSRLNHPSVVGVHQVFEDNETAYMALDLIDGHDVLEIIEKGVVKFSPDQIQEMTLKLLDAIEHVHSQDLLHRDISPDNILVDKTGHPVLIDFGAAREEASRKSRVLSLMLVVKDGYSPQEFYVAGSKQMPCSDLYALAASLTHLIAGQAPPNSQRRLAALASNQPDLYQPLFGRFPAYDDAFLMAIDRAMSIVPAERLQTAQEWSLMIDHRKRVEIARSKAQNDETIDQTVMKLVRDVEIDVEVTGDLDPVHDPDTQVDQPMETDPRQAEDAVAQLIAEDFTAENDEVLDTLNDEFDRVLDDCDPEPIISGVHVDEAAGPKMSPYLRVTSKALRAAEELNKPVPAPPKPIHYRRLATVPVVFSAYFFYTYTILQLDGVQAAAVQPLLAFGQEISSWNEPSSSGVTVRRGTGG